MRDGGRNEKESGDHIGISPMIGMFAARDIKLQSVSESMVLKVKRN